MKLQTDIVEAFYKSLPNGGVFINTRGSDGKDNTMVIGCGGIMDMWGKIMIEVPIRHNRYSWQLLEDNPSFVISIPKYGELKDALKFCGTKSGRDIKDKFAVCNLTNSAAIEVDAPIIEECEFNIECKVFYKQDMIPANIPPTTRTVWHKDDRYHTLYYGEIVRISRRK